MEKERNNKAIVCKKLYIRAASYIVVLSLIVSVFSINIYAEEPTDDTYLDTYAAHYFNHLASNFGNNTDGTCGFVAAGMLLSFYDSYLNDNFISKDCNCNSNCNCDYDALGEIDSDNIIYSPGIKREENWKYLTDYADYNAFIDANANKHFHLRLLQIGRDEPGLYSPPTQNQRSSGSTTKPEDSPWGITISEVGDVIQAWINKGEQIIKNNVTIHISSYNDDEHINLTDPNSSIRNEAIEKVEVGIPVIYYGYNEDEGGHFMIAHDYDEATNTLYFHTGWGDHIMNDKETERFIYTANTSILWFEIDDELVHSCSDNYAYSTSPTTASLCACQMYSGSLNHTHNYSINIFDANGHYSRCVCGKITTNESHNLAYPSSNATQHWERCIVPGCGYGCGVNHNYNTFLSHTEAGHTLQCACGETRTEAHYSHRRVSNDSLTHNTYCICGYLVGTHSHSFVMLGGTARCRFCSYVRPIGQVILGKKEENVII